MQSASLEKRVEVLENTVLGVGGIQDRLGLLQADVTELRAEVQTFRGEFLQFKDETRVEFSAIRQEMTTGFVAIRQEMTTGLVAVRQEMKTEFAAVQQGLTESKTRTSALYEDLIARIAMLHEGLNVPPRRRKRRS